MQCNDKQHHNEPETTIEPVEAQVTTPGEARQLRDLTRSLEVAEVLSETAEERDREAGNDDHAKRHGMYRTKMQETHKRQRQRRDKRILDPGGRKIDALKRRASPVAKEIDARKYANKVARETGEDVDEVRRRQDAARADRAVRKVLKQYLIHEWGMSESGALKKIKRSTDDEKTTIRNLAESAGYSFEPRTAERPQPERVGVPQQSSPAFPAREPLRASTNPQYCQSIVAYRDLNKADIRATIEADTAAFLARGGRVDVMPDWYPEDRDCLLIGGKRHIKSTWGYVPNKPVKGNPNDY